MPTAHALQVQALAALCACSDNHDIYTTDAGAAKLLSMISSAGLVPDLARQVRLCSKQTRMS